MFSPIWRLIIVYYLTSPIINTVGEDGRGEVETMTTRWQLDQHQSVNDKIKSLQNLLYNKYRKYEQPSSLDDRLGSVSSEPATNNNLLQINANSFNRLKRENCVGHHPCACIPRQCCYHDNVPNKGSNLNYTPNNPLCNCNSQTCPSNIKCLPRNYCACNVHNVNPTCTPRDYAYNANNQNINPYPTYLPKDFGCINNNEPNINANPIYTPRDYTYNRNDQIINPNPTCPTPNDYTYNRNDQIINPNPICPTSNDYTYNRNDQFINPNPICPTPNDYAYNRNDQFINPNPTCPTPNDYAYNRHDQIINPNPTCPTPNDYAYNRNDQIINPNPTCPPPACCNNRCPNFIPEDYPYNNNVNHMVTEANTVNYNSANTHLLNGNHDRLDYETPESNRSPQKFQLNENRAFGFVAKTSTGAREVIYDQVQEQRKKTEINYGTPAPNAFRYSVQDVGNRFQEVIKAPGLVEVPKVNVLEPVLQKAPPIVDDSNVNFENSGECCIPKPVPEQIDSCSEEEAAASNPCGSYQNCWCDSYDQSMQCPVQNSCDYSSCYPNRTKLKSIEEEKSKTDTRGFTIGVSQNRILGNSNDYKETRNETGLKDIKELEEGDVVGEFRGRILFSKQGLTLSVDHLSLPYLDKFT